MNLQNQQHYFVWLELESVVFRAAWDIDSEYRKDEESDI
jgi:hypothetical protein